MNVTKFHILTLFPEMIVQGLNPSVIGRAAEKGIISLDAVNIRDYTQDRHGKVDDYPYGGGAGMLMQAQPVYDAHQAVTKGRPVRTVYVTPQGMPFTQKKAQELAGEQELVFLCGHYEGIDERVLERIVTDYISIGDYVLTGGELAAMVMIDAIARLIPGVLGNDSSAQEESFYNDLLEYPQYSRPESWQGERVPEVLLSGNHSKVAAWRLEQSIRRTADRRPDLYRRYQEKQQLIKRLSREKRDNIHMMESLARGRGEILCADQGGILLWDAGNRLCMAAAADAAHGERLADKIPEDADRILASQDFLCDIFAGRQYGAGRECVQMLYTQKVTLPVKRKCVRKLTENDCTFVRNKTLYGAFSEDILSGYISIQGDGSLGTPWLADPEDMETARSLAAHAVNRLLEKGWTPYAQVPAGDAAAEALLEGLGFYRAKKSLWRLEKRLANSI